MKKYLLIILVLLIPILCLAAEPEELPNSVNDEGFVKKLKQVLVTIRDNLKGKPKKTLTPEEGSGVTAEFANKFAEVRREIEELKGKVKEEDIQRILTKMENVESQMNNLNTKTDNIETKSNDNETAVNEIKENIEEIERDIETLIEDVDKNKSEIESNDRDIEGLDTDMNQAKNDIRDNKRNIDSNDTDIRDLYNKHNSLAPRIRRHTIDIDKLKLANFHLYKLIHVGDNVETVLCTSTGTYASSLGYGSASGGYCSTAIGLYCTAFGDQSSAFGNDCTTYGTGSNAFGYLNVATGDYSNAFGSLNNANNDYSVVFGYDNDASSQGAVAVGIYNTSSGLTSNCFGSSNTASGQFSSAIGNINASSGQYSFTAGHTNTATQIATIAMGALCDSTSDYATSFGVDSDASGAYSIAIGNSNDARGAGSIAFGYSNDASGTGSYAGGVNCESTGTASFVHGSNSEAKADYAIAFGNTAKAYGLNSIAMGASATANGISGIAIGPNCDSYNNTSVAIGNNCDATSNYAIAVGRGCVARSTDSIVIGIGHSGYGGNDANGSLSLGYSDTRAVGAIGICGAATVSGNANQAYAKYGIAIGADAICGTSGDPQKAINSIALGTYATAGATRAISIGYEANYLAGGGNIDSIAIGNDARSAGENAIAIGEDVNVSGYASIGIGKNFTVSGSSSCIISLGDGGGTTYSTNQAMGIVNGDLGITAAKKLYLDGPACSGNTYITEGSADAVDFYAGGAARMQILGTGNVEVTEDFIIRSGKKLWLDGGSNTYMTEYAADSLTIVIGGANVAYGDTGGFGVAAGKNLFVDSGGDTYIKQGAANVMEFYAGGSLGISQSGANVTIAGTLTTGGSDPPYTQYWDETRESIIDYVKANIPPMYLDGATVFFNKDTQKMEMLLASKGEFRDYMGNLLAKTNPIIDTFEVDEDYTFNRDTGKIMKWQKRKKSKYTLDDGVEFNDKDGKFYKNNRAISKKEAIKNKLYLDDGPQTYIHESDYRGFESSVNDDIKNLKKSNAILLKKIDKLEKRIEKLEKK